MVEKGGVGVGEISGEEADGASAAGRGPALPKTEFGQEQNCREPGAECGVADCQSAAGCQPAPHAACYRHQMG